MRSPKNKSKNENTFLLNILKYNYLQCLFIYIYIYQKILILPYLYRILYQLLFPRALSKK